uniref:1-phosphatidylinositol-5-phosphate 4-kinase n=1 Tax=Rodentolepis nana TaxID=102285 RepID=A0A158QJB7_RODNA
LQICFFFISGMATQSKQKKLKGGRQKLKLFRANEPLKSVLMWGINHSLSTLQHMKPRAVLLKDDFKAYLKIKVKAHLFNKENMPSRFKFKEYCPLAFQNLRERFNVDTNDYWESFTRYQPLWDTVSGKSGSKFLVTYNRHYVLKTISSEEVEQMHHFIEHYHEYIVNVHGQTLLPQYLGMYRITVNDQETYLLAMRNVFSPRVTVHRKYDLKGSVVDREANEKEKSRPLPTLKDNDFMNDICELNLEESSKQRLLENLERDIAFLQENNLMDYSALIGIHDVELVEQEEAPAPGTSGSLPCGYPSSASPTGLEVAAGMPSSLSTHRGSTDEMFASAGDGLGEIFEEKLFGPSSNQNAPPIGPGAGFPVGSYPMSIGNCGGGGGGGGGGMGNESLADFSPSNSEELDAMAGGSVEESKCVDYREYRDALCKGGGLVCVCVSVIDISPNPIDFVISAMYTPPDSPADDVSHRLQPFTGELNPISEFYAFRASPCKYCMGHNCA